MENYNNNNNNKNDYNKKFQVIKLIEKFLIHKIKIL